MTDEWIKKTVCVYKGIPLTTKKTEMMPFAATGIDLEILILSEVSQKEKDNYLVISFICGL